MTAKRCRFAPKGQRLTPYQKIVRAGERGTGVMLTAADVAAMRVDTAIRFRAELDDADQYSEFDDTPPAEPAKGRRG
jgi:hypothetical protein